MPPSPFTVPPEDRYFEDYPEGSVYEFGAVRVEAAEIVDFARRFDPQPMHVDAAAAAEGPFGGLIASGWHTAGIMMRLFVEHFLPRAASLGSPGIDELRWPRPVRPGDVLRLRVHVVEARPSRKEPDRGILRTLIEVLNQRDETVMTLKPVNLLRRRPAAARS
ncbi:MAG TPA: MaoC family dehydratase [Stellaceae bacterium]|nr:MaoC family dehydratase [Stellaceae bacterium]